MNKILIPFLTVLISITGSAAAMSPMDGACGGADIDRLQKQLELTEEQAVSLQAILEERFQSRLLMHKRHHDELEQHRTETRERLSALLSEAQVEQLEALRLWHERMRRPGGQP